MGYRCVVRSSSRYAWMRSRASSSVCPWPPRRYRATSSRARTAWVMSSSITLRLYQVSALSLLDLAAYRFGEFRRRCVAANIVRAHDAGLEHACERAANALRALPLADVIEHHQPGQQQRGRIREILVGDVRRAA